MKRYAFRGAFEGLESSWQFSYKKQLSEAVSAVRFELDSTVFRYVARFPTTDYEKLAKRLHISTGKLSEILSKFPHGRKRGRRKAQRTAQHSQPRHTAVVSIPVSHHLGRKDVEQALSTLHLCVLDGRADNAGDDAYQSVIDWLQKGSANKDQRKRAGYLTQRYEALRSKRNSKE